MKFAMLAFSLLLAPTTNEHTVEKGDTLSVISAENEISLWELTYLNPEIEDLNKISVGDIIKIGSEEEIDLESIPSDVVEKVDKKIEKAFTNPVQLKESKPKQKELPTQYKEVKKDYVEMNLEATAYTAYCNGCSGVTAIGLDLRKNPSQKVIAVDPNVIPLGSKVWVEGYGYAIAGDTGGAIKGNIIDVFIPNKQDAYEWGRKQVKVKVYM